MCHMSNVFFLFSFILDKEVKLVVGGSVINGATLSSLCINNSNVLKRTIHLNEDRLIHVLSAWRKRYILTDIRI